MTPAIAFLAALLPLLGQAKEHHEFDYWAGTKTGSWVKIKMEMEIQGMKLLGEITRTVVETGADKVVIESKTKMTVNGQEQPENTQKEEVLKDKDKDPIKVVKESEEEIDVNGKKLKCLVLEGTQKETTKIKFWVNKDVPGGLVKAEVSGGDFPGALKMIAAGWEKK